MRRQLLALLTPLLLMTGTAAAQTTVTPQCALTLTDQAWLNRAMAAWDLTSRTITGVGRIKRLQAVIFDSSCVLTSRTAMNGGSQVWQARRHSGQVELPDGDTIPAGVTSFAKADDKVAFFTMSTPSVWRTAVKSAAGFETLDTLMIAVMLHEGTHVAQMPTYGARMGRLAERYKLPEDFNDDSIQKRFEGNAEFKESIGRETDLLLAAATARDRATAVRLARQARTLMKARQQRWYKSGDEYLVEAEDIWLTLEGSGQWAAHRWLIDLRGGAVDPRAAFGSFGWRGKWWSQNEGFALFMALDRLSPDAWKRHAFGDGQKTVLQLVDEALAAPR